MQIIKTESFNKKTTLSNIVSIGSKKDQIPDDTKVSFITMQDIDFKINKMIEKDFGEVKKGYSHFKENDVLVAKITPCFENGKGAIAKGLTNSVGFGSTEFMVLHDDKNLGIQDFIKYVTQNKRFRKMGAPQMIGGGGQRRIPKEYVLNYPIIDADVDTYVNIGNALSQQEEQVNRIKSLIKKLEKRNQYYAERLLSGELRVRESDDGKVEFYENTEWKEIKVGNKTKRIPTTWNKDSLGDLVSVTTGKKNANAGSEKGSYKFFTCSKEDKRIESYSFDQEAILIAGNGVVGLSKYYNGKFDAYQRTYVLGDFKINGKYLFSFINIKFQKAIEKEIKGGVISYIKLENITDFEVLYPNSDSELKLLITSINNINLELNQAKSLLEKEQKRFDWMSDALLSGEYQIVD